MSREPETRDEIYAALLEAAETLRVLGHADAAPMVAGLMAARVDGLREGLVKAAAGEDRPVESCGDVLRLDHRLRNLRRRGPIHRSTHVERPWTGLVMESGRHSVKFDVLRETLRSAVDYTVRRVLEIDADLSCAKFA